MTQYWYLAEQRQQGGLAEVRGKQRQAGRMRGA
jgi:hypothetical protein